MPAPIDRTRRAAAAALLAAAVAAPGLAGAEPRRFEIDPEHFSVGFLVEHVGYERLLGMFLEGDGRFVYDEASRELHGGEVVIQADSVFTNHADRDEHVRSDDFLDADGHPTIRFVAGELHLGADGSGTLAGELTLLGETRPVTLDVTLNRAARYPFGHEQYVLGISARGRIKRSDFGMTYALDGDLVGDTVDLILELEAIRQPK